MRPEEVRTKLIEQLFQNQRQAWNYTKAQQNQTSPEISLPSQISPSTTTNTTTQPLIKTDLSTDDQGITWWPWWILLILIILAWVTRKFWYDLKEQFYEYQELKEETEKTYASLEQSYQWQQIIEQGQQALKSNDFPRAINLFKDALTMSQSHDQKGESYYLLGQAHFKYYQAAPQEAFYALGKAENYFNESLSFAENAGQIDKALSIHEYLDQITNSTLKKESKSPQEETPKILNEGEGVRFG